MTILELGTIWMTPKWSLSTTSANAPTSPRSVNGVIGLFVFSLNTPSVTIVLMLLNVEWITNK